MDRASASQAAGCTLTVAPVSLSARHYWNRPGLRHIKIITTESDIISWCTIEQTWVFTRKALASLLLSHVLLERENPVTESLPLLEAELSGHYGILMTSNVGRSDAPITEL